MDIVTYALSKKYTKDSLEGMGALKGKNCTISSIDPIKGGNRVTFTWTLDDGTPQTTTMDVIDGEDGASIVNMIIDDKGHLIVTLSNSAVIDAGEIPTISEDVEQIIEEEVAKQIESQLQETIQDAVDKAVEEALAGSSGSDIDAEIDSWF